MSQEEPATVAALIKLCKEKEIACLVQIGAEDGYEADEIRKATGCRAICTDPDPKCVPVSNSLEFHEVLIGGENSIVNFFINSVPGLSSKIAREDSQEMLVCIPQYRLDRFCEKYDIEPDALIIDTEGTTMDVLMGCGGLLNGVKLIYAEVQHSGFRGPHGQAMEVDAYLIERGFKRSMELPTYSAGEQSNWTWMRP